MQLNGRRVIIEPYASDSINGETIIFIESQAKVLSANDTAVAILHEIALAETEGRNTSTEEIARHLCESYSIRGEQMADVFEAVQEAIDMFFTVALLKTGEAE